MAITGAQLLNAAHNSWNFAIQISAIQGHNQGLKQLLAIPPAQRTSGTDAWGHPLVEVPDINTTAATFRSPLEGAAMHGNLEGIKLLMNHGANVGNAINFAQHAGHNNIAEYIATRLAAEQKLGSRKPHLMIANFVAGGRRKSYRKRKKFKRKSRRRRKRRRRKKSRQKKRR